MTAWPAWLASQQSEVTSYLQAWAALNYKVSPQALLGCSGSACFCHGVGSLVQQLYKAAAALLQDSALFLPDAAAATEQELQEARWLAQLQVAGLAEQELWTQLPRGAMWLLQGQHSLDAVCSLADAFNRWGCQEAGLPSSRGTCWTV